MKILLILPIYQPGKVTANEVSLPSTSLHLIAGLTPSEIEVEIVEEELQQLDMDIECDLVGISCMTSNVTRGYYLADEFRKRGKTVVMGGIHPSLLPDEALLHCDSVVIGEVENIWATFLHDFQNKTLKKKYSAPYPVLDKYIPLKMRKSNPKIAFGAISLETTRGCPYTCNFCTVPIQFGRKQRHRPVEHVVREINESGGKTIIFMDDNILGSAPYAKKLLKALIPLKIKWGGQANIKAVQNNPELIPLAQKSGCLGLFFGIESVTPAMDTLSKSFKSREILSEQLDKVRDAGIHAHTAMIFGFDEDTEGVFDETLEFLLKNKVGSASFHPLTPYPGTDLYNKLDRQGRILTKNWNDYHYHWGTIVFQPKNFTPEQLFLETIRVKREYTSFKNVLAGAWKNRRHPLLHFAVNYGFNKEAKESEAYWKQTYAPKYNL
jgi:radical SAM superfamily enzyme YgiQ (UPF0313 family)